MPSNKLFDITLGDINFLLDQMRDAIVVLRYQAGTPIYGFYDFKSVPHELGALGQFTQNGQPVDPLAIIDPVTGLSIYDGAREASGLRLPIGLFNNLVDVTRWTWGTTDNPFPRLTQADYQHYLSQVLANPALTNGGAGYVDLHPTVTNPNATTTLATPAAYADLSKSVVDYTPRMITQTISSSYGAPSAAASVGIAVTGTDAAQTVMSAGELLIVYVGATQMVFQFYNSASQANPSTINASLIGIDVTAGVTVSAALAAVQAALIANGGAAAAGASAGVVDGHISIALGTPDAGSLSIFDYAGLGLGGIFTSSVDNTNSALIRTGVYTDVFVSDGVIGALGADGVVNTADDGHVVEYVSRNLNTLPGDPSTSGIFTLFGQFFDHGLDFIGKGGQGSKIIIPLSPNDPLYRAPNPGANDPGNTTITISRATPDGYTVEDFHGRPMSIAGGDNVWGTADDLSAPGVDGVYGTADDVHAPMIAPATTSYSNHTSPYIDQSQSYGSDTQTTLLLREWVLDPNTGLYRPGAELLDGHVTQAYNSQVFDDSSATGLGVGVTTRTLPTLNEMREHIRDTGRSDLTWDDVNNLRARDDHGQVIDTNGAATGGYVYTGEALLLDMNPRFDAAHLHPDDNNAATDWDSNETTKVDAAIAVLSASMTGGNTFGWVNNALTLHLAAPFGPLPAGDYTGAYAMAMWVNFANFSIIATDPTIYSAVGEIMMASVGDHYIAGDGRANENFGLTALHHVFHENHNVQLINLENMVLSSPNADARHGYQLAVSNGSGGFFHDQVGNYTLTDQSAVAVASIDQISWDPDKMFEAAKLINEMEYQHVAIDQYARLVTPDLPEFVTYDNDIKADISLEYSQAAFRFGHSQLRETIDAIDPAGQVTKWALSVAFLNPGAYAATGAESIVRGMSQQLTNEVDEFLTPAMQQSLLGQPLDLGAINIARGRDVGMPTLNQVRAQLHDALVAERAADPSTPHHTNLIVDALNPYTSWAEFGSQMQHPESLVNFIAAYSFDGDLAKAQEVMDLETGVITTGALTGMNIQQAIAFLNGGDNGYDKIDFWMGGLAELHVFTGQLGTTFNAIFEDQMERLMDGDRFYYLYRLGLALNIDPDLGHAVVTEQFKDIIERTTGALHLNGDVMGYADSYVELAKTHAADLANSANAGLGIYTGSGNGTAGNGSILHKSNTDLGLVNQGYIADFRPDIGGNPDGTPASGYNSHEVISGTDLNDWLDAGNGDDTIYGDKGNDVLDGKAGADHIYGGDGQDVIYGGDIEDFLDGGAGDDIVYGGTSAGVLDVVIGGAGNDKLYGEAGIDEIYGGAGDDYIDAGGDTDLAFGDGGNDIMYGGDGPDELRGGEGDDILSGGSGSDQLKGEHGDDIFLGGIGQAAQTGDSDEALGDTGFDMTSFSDTSIVLDTAADLRNVNLTAAPGGTAFEPFNQLWTDIEGVIGSKFSDVIIGADAGAIDAEGVRAGDNWLVGGSGADTFGTTVPDATGSIGSGGNDVIIGDSIRLDTLIGRYGSYTNTMDANGNAVHGHTDFSATSALGDGLLGNAELGTQMFAKHYTELLKTEAHKNFVLGGDSGAAATTAANADIAVFTGNKADYTLTALSFVSANEGTITAYKIVDNRAGSPDGTDLLVGIEKLKFADQTVSLVNSPPTLDLYTFDSGNYRDEFTTSSFSNSNGTQSWAGASWVETGDNASPGSGQIQIDAGGGGGTNELRFLGGTGAGFDGASIQRTVNLANVTSATLSYSYDQNNIDAGETVTVQFSSDGTFAAGTIQTAQTITNASGNNSGSGSTSVVLTGPFTANSAIRFVATGINATNEDVRIDNVNIAFNKPVIDGTNNYAATYTEGGASVAIASGPAITDDGTQIASAKIVLTNALAGDVLNRNDINNDGITVTTTSAAGQITVTLTGLASFAAYQAAIQAITFSSASNNPTNADRIIQVTVNDGLVNSNVATSTIHVVPTNDAPNANTDYVIANTTSVIVPEWTLLANDTDADGPLLDVTATSNNNGVTTSLVTNPGAVTITDTGPAGGSFTYTVNDGSGSANATDTATANFNRTTSATTLTGATGFNFLRDEIIIGGSGGETITGNGGNDIVLAGGGNDTIIWNANAIFTDGHDFIDGGAGTVDTFIVNGRNGAETFAIYSNTDHWDGQSTSVSSAAHAGFTGLNANTEIVVTRNGAVIAELDNVEEITVNTLNTTANNGDNPNQPDAGTSGGDTIQVVGNFTGTSLNYSTITVNGGDGDDSVDVSGRTSEHRIVFHGAGGTNHVIGGVRPQDVVDGGTASGSGGSTGGSGNSPAPAGNSDAPAPADPAPVAASAPLVGTEGNDVLVGSDTSDTVLGRAGDDSLFGNSGDDVIRGDAGNDHIEAGVGADVVFTGSGDDDAFGGAGSDMIYGEAGSDRMFGDGGADMLDGGTGDDTVFGGAGNDLFIGKIGDGNDTYDGGEGNDTLDLGSITQAVKVNLGTGVNGHGSVVGAQSGTDTLYGIENVTTGSGNDTITASNAVNVIDGGDGNDIFVFGSVAAANGDTIVSFQTGDIIDLSGIDANSSAAGTQTFSLVTAEAATAAGQIVITHETRADGDFTIVSGNTAGNNAPEFKIEIGGSHNLTSADFHF